VNTTRYCKYSHVLLMMGENIARNMYSRLGIINSSIWCILLVIFIVVSRCTDSWTSTLAECSSLGRCCMFSVLKAR